MQNRLNDILAEMVDLKREGNRLCAEAARMHSRKSGDHVNLDGGAQGIIVHVSCKVELVASHYSLIVTEHIARMTPLGRPTKRRLTRTSNLAEEWLSTSAHRDERREFQRTEGSHP